MESVNVLRGIRRQRGARGSGGGGGRSGGGRSGGGGSRGNRPPSTTKQTKSARRADATTTTTVRSLSPVRWTKSRVETARDPTRPFDHLAVIPPQFLLDEIDALLLDNASSTTSRRQTVVRRRGAGGAAVQLQTTRATLTQRTVNALHNVKSSVPWTLVGPMFAEYVSAGMATNFGEFFFADYIRRANVRAAVERLQALLTKRTARPAVVATTTTTKAATTERCERPTMTESMQSLVTKCERAYQTAPWMTTKGLASFFLVNVDVESVRRFGYGETVMTTIDGVRGRWKRAKPAFYETSCRGRRDYVANAIAYYYDDETAALESLEDFQRARDIFLTATNFVRPQSIDATRSIILRYRPILRLGIDRVVHALLAVSDTNDELAANLARLVSLFEPPVAERRSFIDRVIEGCITPERLLDVALEDTITSTTSPARLSEIETLMATTRSDVERQFAAELLAGGTLPERRFEPTLPAVCDRAWLNGEWTRQFLPTTTSSVAIRAVVVRPNGLFASDETVADGQWSLASDAWYDLACRRPRVFRADTVGYLLDDNAATVIVEDQDMFEAAQKASYGARVKRVENVEKLAPNDESYAAAYRVLSANGIIDRSPYNVDEIIDAVKLLAVAQREVNEKLVTNDWLAATVARLLVYLHPLIRVNSSETGSRAMSYVNQVHIERVLNGQYSTRALVGELDERADVLPEVFLNPDVSVNMRADVERLVKRRQSAIREEFYDALMTVTPGTQRRRFAPSTTTVGQFRPVDITVPAICPANVVDVVYYLDPLDKTLYCFDRTAIAGVETNPQTNRRFADEFLSRNAQLMNPASELERVVEERREEEEEEEEKEAKKEIKEERVERATRRRRHRAGEELAPGLFERLRQIIYAMKTLYCAECNETFNYASYASLHGERRVTFCSERCFHRYSFCGATAEGASTSSTIEMAETSPMESSAVGVVEA